MTTHVHIASKCKPFSENKAHPKVIPAHSKVGSRTPRSHSRTPQSWFTHTPEHTQKSTPRTIGDVAFPSPRRHYRSL